MSGEPRVTGWDQLATDRGFVSATAFLIVGAAFLMMCGGCEKRPVPAQTISSAASPSPTASEIRIVQVNADACAFIERQEIQQITGASVKETKASGSSDGHLRFLQCYYVTEEPNRSVSVFVTQPDPAATDRAGATKSWRHIFDRFEVGERKDMIEGAVVEEKEEEHRVPVIKIDGIGDKAFWAGSKVGAALYVLKNGVYVRVSLSGPEDEHIRIEHAKVLAEKALERLQNTAKPR